MARKCPTYEEISLRAYQIFLQNGCRPGHETDDWLQAEYELIGLPLAELEKLPPPKASEGWPKAKSVIEVVQGAMSNKA